MKQIIKVFSSHLFSNGLMAVLSLLLIRHMAVDEYAQYTFLLSIVTLITGILCSGVNSIIITGYQEFHFQENVGILLPAQMLCVLLAAAAIALFNGTVAGNFLIVIVLMIATCFSELTKTVYQQRLCFGQYSLIEIVRSVLFFVLFIGYFAITKGRSISAVGVLCVKSISFFLVSVIAAKGVLRIRDMLQWKKTTAMIWEIVRSNYKYLYLYFALLNVFGQVDIYVIRLMGTDFDLASYGAGFKYYSLLGMVLASVHAVFFPGMQKAETKAELSKYFKAQRIILFLAIPVVILGDIASVYLIPLLDGGKYPGSIGVFIILSVMAILSLMLSPYMNVVMKYNQFRYITGVILVTLLLNAALTPVLFQALGIAGAALGTLLAQSSLNFFAWLKAKRLILDNMPD